VLKDPAETPESVYEPMMSILESHNSNFKRPTKEQTGGRELGGARSGTGIDSARFFPQMLITFFTVVPIWLSRGTRLALLKDLRSSLLKAECRTDGKEEKKKRMREEDQEEEEDEEDGKGRSRQRGERSRQRGKRKG
jgi:hypothetical protein